MNEKKNLVKILYWRANYHQWEHLNLWGIVWLLSPLLILATTGKPPNTQSCNKRTFSSQSCLKTTLNKSKLDPYGFIIRTCPNHLECQKSFLMTLHWFFGVILGNCQRISAIWILLTVLVISFSKKAKSVQEATFFIIKFT